MKSNKKNIICELLFATGLDMVVRDENGDILDTNKTSTTHLYEHHLYAVERIRKATVGKHHFKFTLSVN